MLQLSFKRHRFPPEIIRHLIWLYARFTLSFRNVEDLLAERGLDISYGAWRGAQHCSTLVPEAWIRHRR